MIDTDGQRPDQILRAGTLALNVDRWTVAVNGTPLRLRPMEFRLLMRFMEAKGRMLTYEVLADQVWGQDYNPASRTMSSHICHLRGQLGTEGHRIICIKGIGYRMDVE